MPIPLKLTVFRGSSLVQEETFTRDIVKIGRLASAHLRLEDEKVSRIHAVIQAHSDGTGYDLIDMGSADGTTVNGERVSKRRLSNGDELVMGASCVKVALIVDSAAADPSADVVQSGDVVQSTDIARAPMAVAASTGSIAQNAFEDAYTAAAQAAGISGSLLPGAPPPSMTGSLPGASAVSMSGSLPPVPRATGSIPATQTTGSLHPATPQSGGHPTAPPGGGQVAGHAVVHPAAIQPGAHPPGVHPPGVHPAGAHPGAYQAHGHPAGPPPGVHPGAHQVHVHPAGTHPPGQVPMPAPVPHAAGHVTGSIVPPSPAALAHPGWGAPASTHPPAAPMPAAPFQNESWPATGLDAWGSVPNNLASQAVPDTERQLEIKALWGSTVLDTINAYDRPQVTLGDERKVIGWGPLQRVQQADVEVPSKGLPTATWVLAEASGKDGCNYVLHLPPGYVGRIERADGTAIPFDALRKGGYGAEPGDHPGAVRYALGAEETVYLARGQILLQIRYVRKNALVPPPLFSDVNYTWLNILVMVFFFTAMAVTTFIATPITTADPAEELYKNSNRFAQFRLTPEQKRKSDLLSQLKGGSKGAKAAKKEGKSGRKNYKRKTQGRTAVKGDPSKKDLAQSALQRLFGKASQSGVFGKAGLGGELKSALGGISGARVGDAAGLGGLGTRGSGPGGGGLSMSSVGLGALGTRGRGGGGDGSYGEGATGIGRKIDRDISISAGSPIIMGSLDKEIIRRIIKQHIAQIRYCYEKELVRSPGLFGKVATQFTISAQGRVQSAKVTQTTLNNAVVERCITSKIRTWKFPKPKGGGIVIVKYPFILKTAG